MATNRNLSKPKINSADARKFAEGSTTRKRYPRSSAENAPEGQKSGKVPAGNVRLTVNIPERLYKALKHRSVDEMRTMGKIVEELLERSM